MGERNTKEKRKHRRKRYMKRMKKCSRREDRTKVTGDRKRRKTRERGMLIVR